MARGVTMSTTIGQAKAIIRRKFDHAEDQCRTWMANQSTERKANNMPTYHDAVNKYYYWLGQRAILAELLTSIDET